MKIRNWSKFQHYKTRKPPWIRLYADLLDDPDWHELSDEAKAFMLHLWLLASQHSTDGTLPDSRVLARRLHLDSKTTNRLFRECKQWLENDASNVLADSLQDASDMLAPETETETDTESETETEIITRKRVVYGNDFEMFWELYPRKIGKGAAFKAWQKVKGMFTMPEVLAAARLVKESVDGGAKLKYIKHPATWLNAHGWEDEEEEDEWTKVRRLADDIERQQHGDEAIPKLSGPGRDNGGSEQGYSLAADYFDIEAISSRRDE